MGAKFTVDGAVWVFTIDRPTRRNALDGHTSMNLAFMLQQANADPVCRAVVIVGSGPWFCSGSDMKEFAGLTPSQMEEIERKKAELIRTIGLVDVPVVAAVSGFALGGGLALAAACDLVVSDPATRWHMAEVGNGWLPPWGVAPILARVGLVRSRAILWGATALDAAEAHRFGLVDEISEAGGALALASERAHQLARLPAASAASVKPYLRQIADATALEADRVAAALFLQHCDTEQARNTLAKFGGATALPINVSTVR